MHSIIIITTCFTTIMDYFICTVTAPVVTAQPVSSEVLPGDTATFSVIASGGGDLVFQWFFNGITLSNIPGEISGANESTLLVIDVQQGDLGNYQLRVSNTAGFVDSVAVQLTLREYYLILSCKNL